MEENNSKSKNIIICVLVLIILVLIGLLVYFKFIKKDNNEPKPNGNNITNNENIDKEIIYSGLTKEDTSQFTNGFDIYYDKLDKDFCYYDDITKCSSNKIFIRTETDNIKKYNEFEDKYVFYKDNDKIKVYDNKKGESYIINIDSNYFGYNFNVDFLTKEFEGIIYFETDESYASYYSVRLNKTLYDKEYRELYFLSDNYLMGNEYECESYNCRQTKTNLLSAKENNKLLSYTLKNKGNGIYEERMYYELLRNDKNTYICLSTFIDATIYVEIYNTDYKKIASDIGEYSAAISSDGSLYIAKDGITTKYNKNGEVVKTSEKYNVLQVINDYIVTIKDDNLVLIDIDGIVKTITQWNKNDNEYVLYQSKLIKENEKEKIVLSVKDKNVTLNDVWQFCLESNKCDNVTEQDLKEYYTYGYNYYYDKSTNKITKEYTYMQ